MHRLGRRFQLAAGLACLASALANPARAAEPDTCRFAQFAELPLKFEHNRPLIQAEVNDHKGWFLVDTGSGASMLFADAAQAAGVRIGSTEVAEYRGIGGTRVASMGGLTALKLGAYSVKNASILVAGEASFFGQEANVFGIIGRDLMAQSDVEFDLAHSMLRLFKADRCKDVSLAYWTQTPSMTDLHYSAHDLGAVLLGVKLNGRRVTALLDSGAPLSTVTTGAASAAGVTPRSTSVAATAATTGLGGTEAVTTFVATFGKLEIGDESVSNAKLRVADMFRMDREAKIGSHVPTTAKVCRPCCSGPTSSALTAF